MDELEIDMKLQGENLKWKMLAHRCTGERNENYGPIYINMNKNKGIINSLLKIHLE